jgi:cysteine protease ATG4
MTVSYTDRALSTKNQESSGLQVYVTGDGSDVYEDTFMDIAKSGSNTVQPTLILIGIRLGIERVTPAYWEALKSSLKMPQSMGIAGFVETPFPNSY